MGSDVSLHPLLRASLRDQLRALRSREISASELLELCLDAHARRDAEINAVPLTFPERAREEAAALDAKRARGEPLGALAGLPMTIKEASNLAGTPTTMGSRLQRNFLPDRDAVLVARLREAGAVIWGKTNVPLGCYDWQSKNRLYGVTRNPWMLERGAGGSSGGSAAALAAGYTAAELGSDMAGSIRNPASLCGVTGLRPSNGLLPLDGAARMLLEEGLPANLLTAGPMARHVGDLRVLLEVLLGPDAGQPTTPGALPGRPYTLDDPEEPADVRGLKIGLCKAIGGVELSAEVDAAMEGLRAKLVAGGAEVEDAPLDELLDVRRAHFLWGLIHGAEIRGASPVPLGPLWALAALGHHILFGVGNMMSRGVTAGMLGGLRRYLKALSERDRMARRFDAYLAGVDVWIAPVAPIVAFPHQRRGAPIAIDGRRVAATLGMGIYVCPLAALGVPALALPIARSSEGLPIGVQLVARRWQDRRLLTLGERVEGVLDYGARVVS